MAIKMQNICSTDLMTTSKYLVEKDTPSRIPFKDSIGLKKIEERDRQFHVVKIIHTVDFKNPYENYIEKKPEIIENVENNSKIIIRVYQHLYADIADTFFSNIFIL